MTCSLESHEDLKDLARSWLEYKRYWPEQLPTWLDALTADDQRRLGTFIATRKPWPGTTLLYWNCECNSTLAVCGDCRDEGEVEVRGKIEQCDCKRDDASDAYGDARKKVA